MNHMQLSRKIGTYLAVLSILTTGIYADETTEMPETPPQESQEAPLSTDNERMMTHEEYVQMQEKRAQEDRELEEQGGNQDSPGLPLAKMIASIDEDNDEETKQSDSYSATEYTGIFQRPIWFAADDSSIQLQDGSIWQVAFKDVPKIENWLDSHFLYVTPNRWYFSSYRYEIINTITGQRVEANRLSDPIFGYRQIKLIDYDFHHLLISEGRDVNGTPLYSAWTVTASDHYLINKWLPDDKIIVGLNVGISSFSYPYVLVNTATGSYARATYAGITY